MVHANITLDHMIIQPQNHDHHINNHTWHNTNSPSTVGLSLDRNELSDWVEQITKQLIDDDVASQVSEDNFVNSSTPSDFGTRKILRTDNSTDQQNEPPKQISWDDNESQTQRVDSDSTREISLMTLLMESAVAISVDNLGEARRILQQISEIASPHAPSCAERVVAYFAQAMTSRVVSSWIGIYDPALRVNSPFLVNYQTTLLHKAFQAFNTVSPFVKFAHFTSNQTILEAFHDQPFVHVIDLDVMQGLQWPALFHILATRAGGPPERVRLTAVGPSPEILASTGKNLAAFARRMGITFEFNPVAKKPGENLQPWMLNPGGRRPGEALAVHWLRHGLYDATGSDRRTIDVVGALRPRIFTLVEQDMATCHGGGGSFLDRFVGSLHYYSTVFDSLGAWASSDDRDRHAAESGLIWREISNVLAVGGPARSGEEKVGSWRRELAGSGRLAQVAMSGSAVAQAQLILNTAAGGGYRAVEVEGCIRVGWKETSLYTASAWTSMH